VTIGYLASTCAVLGEIEICDYFLYEIDSTSVTQIEIELKFS